MSKERDGYSHILIHVVGKKQTENRCSFEEYPVFDINTKTKIINLCMILNCLYFLNNKVLDNN